ncbi:Oidioi.mRNA.OKI2018_I69.PAR.g9163.t1.cds [Oikopleura dioica]|uniref:Oidioi.mRNA.OKI2018_I69.PAR.g9163.t1.cds n=1 Tax=Oikopleura dioica TaxID=34765 RepID=A0ABN7RJA0_OIKDI|nr:Oidioi.mRNA.OKI2018_I69.PAR.g9163.t1.cds [Oikopleura dioica]
MKLLPAVLSLTAAQRGSHNGRPNARNRIDIQAAGAIEYGVRLSPPQIAHSCEWAYQGENNRLIRCERGETLRITNAWYGRENNQICNVQRGTGRLYNAVGTCKSDATQVIKDRCNGRRQCNLSFSNGFVGDPCYGTTKYLEVTWQCAAPVVAPAIDEDRPTGYEPEPERAPMDMMDKKNKKMGKKMM